MQLPNDGDHRRRHDELYFADDGSIEMTAANLLEQYVGFVDRHRSLLGAEVLDVGSGTSPTDRLIAERGGSYVALETNDRARRQLRARGSCAVSDIAELPDGFRFDVVMMIELIEHLVDPHPLLTAVRKRMANGGVLLVVTPDANGLKSRLRRDDWEQARNPTHVVLYDRHSLEQLLRGHGFEVVAYQRRVRHGRGLRHSVVQLALQTAGLDSGLRLVARAS